MSRRRDDVLTALQDAAGFVSAQQLYGRIRAEGSRIGLATVYRTLQQLASGGEVDLVRTDEGEAVYRYCSTGHHHHLICRHCRRTVEVDSAAVERWAKRIAEENGFAEVEHVVEVFGTCTDCAARRAG
jgi:Fur family transcriptional regulator, ferric uptake regulator